MLPRRQIPANHRGTYSHSKDFMINNYWNQNRTTLLSKSFPLAKITLLDEMAKDFRVFLRMEHEYKECEQTTEVVELIVTRTLDCTVGKR